ncbi:MAG: ferrous iron transporter B [Clostridiales bacterium]|jgi:ferrous iron transport protein B|nr:ferrous iron transporter B [Clostridiales bacterium]
MLVKNIGLAGNPNVGKSTVFNALTGLKQHTGNWPGKTVAHATGKYTYRDQTFIVTDLPGTYSLTTNSQEEEIAREFIFEHELDVIVIVVDATCMERNLNLVLQIIEAFSNSIVCINLLDEAKKKKIEIDQEALSELLGVPVVGIVARSKINLDKLKEQIYLSANRKEPIIRKKLHLSEEETTKTINKAKDIYRKCVKVKKQDYDVLDRRLDKIVTSKKFGFAIMMLLLSLIFWITLIGANYPSDLLFSFLFWFQDILYNAMIQIGLPKLFIDISLFGVYQTLAWVVSVMLPPMAIFFPLFTLLEDFGYLPRVAFNMDRYFQKARAHGKQALTMCMGFGCNACAIIGCRIIESPREKLIAILTNNFVPCNGRFPTLIAIISMFFAGITLSPLNNIISVIILTSVIIFGIIVTLFVSRILSNTILKGLPSSFALELPPYRRPQIGQVIIRSILDRTIFVLGRAVVVAAPAGLVIWILANIEVGHSSIISVCTDFLDPFAQLIGLDGVILLAFILGFPANEIVLPIVIMIYLATGTMVELDIPQLKTLLIDNGWTITTAVCTMLFCLLHFPCGTTCLTIKKETQSWKWTGLAFLIPTITGLIVCFLVAQTLNLILSY